MGEPPRRDPATAGIGSPRAARWWLDLEGPFLIDAPVTLADLRANGVRILATLDRLADRFGTLYTPFYGYGNGRELRPAQYYLKRGTAQAGRG